MKKTYLLCHTSVKQALLVEEGRVVQALDLLHLLLGALHGELVPFLLPASGGEK